MLPRKSSQHITEISNCIQQLLLLTNFVHHDLHDQSLEECSKILQIMIELHFENINHYNKIGLYFHLKISDSFSFFITYAASNVLALFSFNSFSFS